jgi:hypothetical protein
VSEADIDRLVAERVLAREEIDDEQVATLWGKAMAALADSHALGMSSAGAFQLVYTAALQATVTVLFAHGLRPKSTANHYHAFLALQKLQDGLRQHAIRLDRLRITRHRSVYEAYEVPDMDQQLTRARRDLAEALPVLRGAVIEVRPRLKDELAQVRG